MNREKFYFDQGHVVSRKGNPSLGDSQACTCAMQQTLHVLHVLQVQVPPGSLVGMHGMQADTSNNF